MTTKKIESGFDGINSDIGDRIKVWRKHLGLTQVTFAELSGIRIGVLKKYEAGYNIPGGDALASIANTGANINWLLTGEGNMHQPLEIEQKQLSPEELEEFNQEFKHIFDLLLQIEEDKRGDAINEMLSRVREEVRISEMERKLKELENKEK